MAAFAQKVPDGTYIDFNKNGRMDVYEDPSADVEDRVENLLAQMTLDEKTCQMVSFMAICACFRTTCLRPNGKPNSGRTGSVRSTNTSMGFVDGAFPFMKALIFGRLPSTPGRSMRCSDSL